MVQVELVYISEQSKTTHLKLDVPEGSTVGDVLALSEWYRMHPETQDMAVGIYAQIVAVDHVVESGDRIEIYRPLTRDPKERRRQQAKK